MTSRRWVVGEGDGRTVEAIVLRVAPGDAGAIREGRVFLGRRRVTAGSEPVAAGDEVTVAEGGTGTGEGATILARGEGWVAVDKPAGVPTIPDQHGAAHSLLALAAGALGLDPSRLHPTSRLDRDVSGVVVFALERAAAERLRLLRDEHRYVRRYLAIGAPSRPLAPAAGAWTVPIGRARDPKLRAPNGRDAAPARSHFAVVASAPPFVLLALAPITGRTHQLRVHASHGGVPLLGDRSYGGPTRATLSSGRVLAFDRIALHAARVSLAGVVVDSPLPEKLRATWLALGGDDGAWENARTWPLPET